MVDCINLHDESFLHGNFNFLKNDFTFIFNGKRFIQTCFLPLIFRPLCSNLLSTDETSYSFVINTHQRGDFQLLLNTIGNRKQEINKEDQECLCDIFEILGNGYLEIEFHTNATAITYKNVFSNLLRNFLRAF